MNIYKQKYNRQRYDAQLRDITWQFTFESWIDWWGEDIIKRGNKSGQLVMARNGDTGPYHPNNVRKVTANENHSESCANGLGWQKGNKHSAETCAKLSALSKRPKRAGIKRQPWTEERKAKVAATWAAKNSN